MSSHRLFLLLIALMAVAVSAHADVYKYYDSNGNLVLTDAPPKDRATKVEKIETKPVMTIPALKGAKGAASVVNEKPVAGQVKAYVIVIQSPSSELAYQRGGGESIPVAVSISPSLAPGHRLEFLLDGKVNSAAPAVLKPDELDSGSHQLLVRVVDGGSNVLSSSAVTFQVQQHDALDSTPKPNLQ